MKYAVYIGRFQPYHFGHKWLIDQKLKKGIPCLILVRNVLPDENNPMTGIDVVNMLKYVFENDDVLVDIIPDIESVNYGRGVGYEINEFVPPKNIKMISGTEIRKRIRENDDSWRDYLEPRAVKWIEEHGKY